ncbi:MAG: hypothetical protein V3T17_13520 [Pseudomonadales bacterium]
MANVVGIQQVEPGIVQITLQDEEHKNTFSTELTQELIQAFDVPPQTLLKPCKLMFNLVPNY